MKTNKKPPCAGAKKLVFCIFLNIPFITRPSQPRFAPAHGGFLVGFQTNTTTLNCSFSELTQPFCLIFDLPESYDPVLRVFSVFRLPGLLIFFGGSKTHFSSEKTRVRLLVPLFCDSIGTKKILTSDFSKKTKKIENIFRFQKCTFCFVPVYVRVLANSPGARRTVIESLAPPFATGSRAKI